jgi:polyisoprenoid-binding protein YceI
VLVRLLAAAALLPLASPTLTHRPAPAAAPSVWTIDKSHSNVGFQIRHFVSNVHGTFGDFKGTITADDDAWQNAVIEVEIATSSINTNSENRDKDLRSSNFFAVDSFPTITFRSTHIERSGSDAKISGNLTMRGVTKPVVLVGHFNGMQKGAKADRVGFDASTTINRLDYGVTWNRVVEGGGAMLGDDVKIEISVEATRSKS